GQHQTDIGAGIVLVLQVVLILIGVEVAGEGVDRLQHSVECAERDTLHIGLFDVLALDSRHHVAEDTDVFVRIVGGSGTSDPLPRDEHQREQRGAAYDKILDTTIHRFTGRSALETIISTVWTRGSGERFCYFQPIRSRRPVMWAV